MVDPISFVTGIFAPKVLIAILAMLGIAVAFWPYIVHVMSTLVIPSVRKYLGESLANGMLVVMEFLDGKICPTRLALSSGLTAIKDRILGIRTRFRKRSATEVGVHTEAYLLRDQGDAVKISTIKEEVLTRDQLPDDVRREMDRRQVNGQSAEVIRDTKSDVIRATEKLANEKGIDLSN